VIARAIKVEGICAMSCYLTTKIPSALLMAVGWLQHTRYPRFCRGTFDYGVTTSPNKRGRVGVRNFMRMHVSIPMLPKCICYAVHAQEEHFNLNHKVGARPKETSSGFRNQLDLWLARNSWSAHLDWSQLSIIMPHEQHCWKRRLIKAVHRWGFSELPNNIWNYNAD
jgi:hypothetical protein